MNLDLSLKIERVFRHQLGREALRAELVFNNSLLQLHSLCYHLYHHNHIASTISTLLLMSFLLSFLGSFFFLLRMISLISLAVILRFNTPALGAIFSLTCNIMHCKQPKWTFLADNIEISIKIRILNNWRIVNW